MRSNRKETGKLLKKLRKKKRYQRGRDYLPTLIGESKVREINTKGGGKKLHALSTNIANVAYKGKTQKTKILTVLENPADPHFVRRNIVTKGAVVETELGKARVTSRPGQKGVVDAILLKEEKEK